MSATSRRLMEQSIQGPLVHPGPAGRDRGVQALLPDVGSWESGRPDHHAPSRQAASAPRWARLSGLGALAALGLGLGLYLALPQQPGLSKAQMRVEPATLGGMNRALSALQADVTGWRHLVVPASVSAATPLSPMPSLSEPAAGLMVASRALADRPLADRTEPAHPERIALIALAATLAAATLLAGLAALLLERALLAPFRAMRAAAAALSEGHLHSPVPGTERNDEAGVLARALERFRQVALAREAEGLELSTLPQAGARIAAAARQIECIAADAAALALEASLTPHPSQSNSTEGRAMAEQVQDLARQVVLIRGAAADAVLVLGHLSHQLAPPAGAEVMVSASRNLVEAG